MGAVKRFLFDVVPAEILRLQAAGQTVQVGDTIHPDGHPHVVTGDDMENARTYYGPEPAQVVSTGTRLKMSDVRLRSLKMGNKFFSKANMRFMGDSIQNYSAMRIDGKIIVRRKPIRVHWSHSFTVPARKFLFDWGTGDMQPLD